MMSCVNFGGISEHKLSAILLDKSFYGYISSRGLTRALRVENRYCRLQESFSGLDIVLILITAALLVGRSSEKFQKVDKVSRYVSISKVSCRFSLFNRSSCFHSHRLVPYLIYISISYRCPSKVLFSF